MNGIMEDSQLSVHVMEAEDLRTTETIGGSKIEPLVVLKIEG